MWSRWTLRIGLVAAAMSVASCGSTSTFYRDLAGNSELIKSEIASDDARRIETITAGARCCIAYLVPEQGGVNSTLKSILRRVRANDPDAQQRHPIIISQSKSFDGAPIGWYGEEVSQIAEITGRTQANATPASFNQISPEKFIERARCGGRESVIVANGQISFYTHQLPDRTTRGGPLVPSRLLLIERNLSNDAEASR